MLKFRTEKAASLDLSRQDLDLLEQLALAEARTDFWCFRQYMNPGMKLGWWQRQIASEFMTFWRDWQNGLRPILVIEAPPQHGKSYQVIDFIAWVSGQNPSLQTIFASFSKRLGLRANLRLQRLFDNDKYQKLFPGTHLSRKESKKQRFSRNSELLEFVGHAKGSFRNTTVGGSITGESLSLGIVDDPIKGREKANSETIRDKTWDWFTDDFFTRFSDDAALLFILTRWHVDDPVGRLILQHPGVRVLKYPAMAEEGIPLMPQDQRVPGSGDALFPEHKSKTFLLLRKAMLAMSSWMSLYQQMPFVLGGNIIKGGDFIRYTVLPKIKYRKIYADTAQKTKEANDFSVFECWGMGEDKKIYLLDLIRHKWEAPDLRQNAIDFWNKHKAITGQGALREMKVEDKASGTGLIQDLKRGVMGNAAIPIFGIERNIDKLTRVMDVLSYIEAGYVCIPASAPFVSDFVTECESFTADGNHTHDDQIDPMCDAIQDLLLSKAKSMFDLD